MEKLNRAQKCSILGPQNLGSGGAWAPRAPLDPHLLNELAQLDQENIKMMDAKVTFPLHKQMAHLMPMTPFKCE